MGRIHYEATRVCVLYAHIQYGISWPSMFVIRIFEGLIWSGKVACIQMEWMNDGFSLIWWKFVWLGKYLSISFWLERISIDKTVLISIDTACMWVARTNKPEHYLASTPNEAIPFGENVLLKSTINYQCHRVKLSWLLNHFCKVAKYYRNETEPTDVFWRAYVTLV